MSKKIYTINKSSVDFGEVELKISQFSVHVSKESSKINHQLSNGVKINEGESFTLLCSVIGDPIPKIYWYRNDQLIDRQWFRYSNKEELQNTNVSELKFQFANENLSGNYTCHAENQHGHVRKSVVVKVVQVETTIKPTEVDSSTIVLRNGAAWICNSDSDCGNGRCSVTFDSVKNKIKNFCKCPYNFSGIHCEEKVLQKYYQESTIHNQNSPVLTNPCEVSCKSAITNIIIVSGLGSLLLMLIIFLIFSIYLSRKKPPLEESINQRKRNHGEMEKRFRNQRIVEGIIGDKFSMEDLLSKNFTSPSFFCVAADNTKVNSLQKHVNIYSLDNDVEFNNNKFNSCLDLNDSLPNNLSSLISGSTSTGKTQLNSEIETEAFRTSVVQNTFTKN